MSFENVTLNLQQKIASNLWEKSNYTSCIQLHLKFNDSFWMHMHAQYASKQHNHAVSTYRVDIAQISQIRYLLSEPVTCPIYLLSGGIPGDSP